MKYILCGFFTLVLWSLSTSVFAQSDVDEVVRRIQKQWAINNYQLKAKEQKEAFIALIADADRFVEQYPAEASVLAWRAIVNASYARIKGGVGALTYAKSAKKDLEKVLELQPGVLKGAAYTTLGTLYLKVPGWPVGFGDKKKAQNLLQKSLAINPNGIDTNYYYGNFLVKKKRYKEARQYYQRALNAAPRAGRELADQGRRAAINEAMEVLEKRL